jgi:hypothetical protein
MKLPPTPMPNKPICNIETPLLSIDLMPERGYYDPMTNISGCKNPNCSLRSLKALSYPQLEQY